MFNTIEELKNATPEQINRTIRTSLKVQCEHCAGEGGYQPEGSNQYHSCYVCNGVGGPDFATKEAVLQPLIERAHPTKFQQCLYWVLGTDDLHAWLTAPTITKAKAWVLLNAENVQPFKRNHWTTEEVIDILKGIKLTAPEGQEPERDIIHHNLVMDEAVSTFWDFARPYQESGAMAYDTDTKFIVHIGQPLPQ